MNQNISNLCVRCKTRFNNWAVYHNHVIGNRCIKKIVPVRTTDRTKAQIIEDVEKTWGDGLIGPTGK